MNPWSLIIDILGWFLAGAIVAVIVFATVSFTHGFWASFTGRRQAMKKARLVFPTTARDLLQRDLNRILDDREKYNWDDLNEAIIKRVGHDSAGGSHE